MATQSQSEKMADVMAEKGPFAAVFGDAKPGLLFDLAVYGCFAVGVIGIIKACDMNDGIGIGLCLLASLVGFGLVIYARKAKI